MFNWISTLGNRTISSLTNLGASGRFLFLILLKFPKLSRVLSVWRSQVYFIGFLSILIIVISALFIGMVVGLQGYHTLDKFGATSELGQLLALSVTRELSPVITALLFAGRAGSAVTAEIGLMKTTEQISSIAMMGIDPLGRIILPRLWAGIIALPLLTCIFSAIAIYGGYWIGVIWLGVDSGTFWSNMQSAINFRFDVLSGMIKSVVFAILVIWIALFQGYECTPTAEGISQATTKTVVYSSLAVLGFDFILTLLMIGDW